MLTRDYYFDLPGELIAQVPTDRRGEERLLVLDKMSGSYKDMMMKDFPSLIEPGSVMVVNNSRVRKARCYGESETGGTVEFLFLEENADHSWNAMVSKAKRQRVGRRYRFLDGEGALVEEAVIVAENEDGTRRVSFSHPLDEDFFTRCGHVPLPPYIKREDDFSDESRYQTVYASQSGSVASPTAGLHFTKELLDEVKGRGVEILPVTLHVGAGTFLPVRSEKVEDHHMHYERYTVSDETADAVNRAKAEGRPIVAVGTTSVRTLESATGEDGLVHPGWGRTNIFIYPGYRFRTVDRLLTNFHTPESTLLMLVSALAGREHIMAAYEHAIAQRYRFYSYGDAMFIR